MQKIYQGSMEKEKIYRSSTEHNEFVTNIIEGHGKSG